MVTPGLPRRFLKVGSEGSKVASGLNTLVGEHVVQRSGGCVEQVTGAKAKDVVYRADDTHDARVIVADVLVFAVRPDC